MARISTAQADAAQNAAIVPSTGYFLSLHTADPGTTGASEGTDGRKAITFGSSSGGTQASTNAQSWPSAVGGQTYAYFGIWTAGSGGTYLRGGTLTSITPPVGATISVATGAITFTAS
jgi:hypothetical protein